MILFTLIKPASLFSKNVIQRKMKKGKRSKKKNQKKAPKTREIEEEEEDYSDSKHTKAIEIPDELSIDRLLETRKTEISNFQINSPTKDDTSDFSSEEPEFKPPMAVTKYVPRDGSTFEFSQGNFPFRIFEILECPEIASTHCIPMIKEWEWLSLKYNSDSVLPNATLLFSLIQELILKKSDEVGKVFIEYLSLFPKNSIEEFDTWFDFVREAMHSSVQSVAYLLAIDFSLFNFQSDDDRENALDKTILLNISAMICPAISENNMYGLTLYRLRETLKSNTFSEKQIKYYIDTSIDLVLDIPISNISLIVSKFPLEGSGVDIIYNFTVQMALYFLLNEQLAIENPTIDDLAKEIKNLKSLCESSNDDDIIKASSVLALSERAVVTGIKLGYVKDAVFQLMIRNMKFSINSSDPGVLTSLKEQIHMTRTQFETLYQTQSILDTINRNT